MRGRKPKPTVLKMLHGTSRPDRVNTREPRPKPGAPPCPEWLDVDAQREWKRIIRELDATGILTQVDRSAFAAYCQGWSQWKAAELRMRARVAAADEARAVFADAVGEERVSALRSLVAAESLVDQAEIQSRNRLIVLLRASAEIGLTPSSRSRVKAATKEEEAPKGAARFFA